MTGIREGDRVHVEFDGEVTWANPHGDLEVLIDGTKVTAETHVDWCTVIVPQIKVGDVVTEANVGQLPNGSVVARARQTPIWMFDGQCFEWTDTRRHTRLLAIGATVLRIGGGS